MLEHLPPPAHLTYLWAQLLIEELVRCGVDTVFIAPGSRSTPLTLTAAQHPHVRTLVHVDERGTAFAALGYGRATGRPAAWITTSGTAVANGLPAVMEAHQDGVPMLLLTADRPPELRDTGANQTVDQIRLFGSRVRWQSDLPAPTADVPARFVLTTASQAVRRTGGAHPGPVHLNCMFRKPLHPTGELFDDAAYLDPLRDWLAGDRPLTRHEPSALASQARFEELLSTERGLIVAGRLRANEADAVAALAKRLGWPLLPDPLSQLRLGQVDAPRVAHYDLLLQEAIRDELPEPETVLYFGRPATSKRLRLYLRDVQPEIIHVDPSPRRLDPDHLVARRIEADVDRFCEAVTEAGNSDEASTFTRAWLEADRRVTAAIDEVLGPGEEVNEPALARMLATEAPAKSSLLLASSMPVREVDRFSATDGSRLIVHANRGASGIDGTLATAAGIAAGSNRPVSVLIGDLALLHDLNSLQLLTRVDAPVVVTVVNNDGGGIFSFLPIHQAGELFESHFGTPHGRSFEHAAAMFGIPYQRAATPGEWRAAYHSGLGRSGPSLIEVRTEREANLRLHRSIDRRVQSLWSDA